jgi:hypothetical protein
MFFNEGLNSFLWKRFKKNGLNMGIAQLDEPSPHPLFWAVAEHFDL